MRISAISNGHFGLCRTLVSVKPNGHLDAERFGPMTALEAGRLTWVG
jgi:hypothetical protein